MYILKKLACIAAKSRLIHTTAPRLSLSEFFDLEKNYGAKKVRTGRPWSMDDLRFKSNTDLHKLWYILFKERNMLYTMQEACVSAAEAFPSPERIDKVEESMANLENVVRERNKAYWQLEVSPQITGERPVVFRRDIFGRHKWIPCSQHLVPYHKNYRFRLLNATKSPDEIDWFYNRFREMKRKEHNARRCRAALYIRRLIRRFPNLDIDFVQEQNPELPPGYVKHLKDNIDLYKDSDVPYFRNKNIIKRSMNDMASAKV